MSRIQRSLFFLVVISLFTALFSTGYAQEASNVLRVATNSIDNIDPAFSPNDPETLLNRLVYDYLIEVTPDNTLAANLADLPVVSEDGLTYTFTLREGVVFHDGTPFTSADVVFTFNRLVEVGSPALNLLGEFEVSAPDASTVVFTLTAPNADFLFGVASRWSLILKDGTSEPNVIGADGSLAAFNGTGPFILETLSPGDRAVFVRNEAYWQDIALDGVELVFFDDPVAQVDALLSGAVDFIFKVPFAQFERIQTTDGVQAFQQATSQHPVIRLRADEGFVGANPLVRQAFKLATDREALNELLQGGLGVVGNNDPISPIYGPYFDSSIENPAYDPEAARALLTEAGYPDGLSLTLFTPDSLGYPDLATVLQQQWAAAGITVDIQVRPESVYYSTVDQPEDWFNVELGITGYGARPTPQQFLVEAYASTGIYNETHWSDPELDALIAQSAVTADQAERAAIFAQISAIFADRGPIIIPWFAPILAGASERVQGLVVAPFPGSTDLRTVSLAN